LQAANTILRDTGAIDNDMIRREFIAIMERIGLGHITALNTLRHTFATILQDANVDPLIRNEVMGHAPQARLRGHAVQFSGKHVHDERGHGTKNATLIRDAL
jgi:integrase